MAELMANTALFLDAVNTGDISEAMDMLYAGTSLDLNMKVEHLDPYTHESTPVVRVDLLDARKVLKPERVLGCVILQDAPDLLNYIMQRYKPDRISDHDAVICTYISTCRIHEIITREYPVIMVNRKLRTGFYSAIRPLEEFIPLFVWCFTPIHAILLSCFNFSKMSVHYTKTKKYIVQQCGKLNLVLSLGGCLNGESPRHLSLIGQVLMSGEFSLAKSVLEAGVLTITSDEMYLFFYLFLRERNTRAISFILHDSTCRFADFLDNDLTHTDILRRGFIRRSHMYELSYITEFLVNNNFTFTGQSYKITAVDTADRIYNLFRAGVYVRDTSGYVEAMKSKRRIVKEIKMFVKRSKTPFSLERLCGLKVKWILGPKHHYEKLLSLKHQLPDHVIASLACYKFTENHRLINPDKWDMPEERCEVTAYC